MYLVLGFSDSFRNGETLFFFVQTATLLLGSGYQKATAIIRKIYIFLYWNIRIQKTYALAFEYYRFDSCRV